MEQMLMPGIGSRTDSAPVAAVGQELLIDNFAGGGGASLGIEAAIGRSVDIAINHDPKAVEIHQRNHPNTRHLCEDVWDVDPLAATGGRPVGLAWFSPDCKHFSRAKGGKPVEKNIRGLAWVALRWAGQARPRPRLIFLENVREFADWGPLNRNHRPIKSKKGQTFQKFVDQLVRMGYEVQWRILDAADYGAPTHRKRLFLIARCDGEPIVWPAASHGPDRAEPYRTAAECIDWTRPCPSIFERAKPLAEATLQRIANGLRKFVIGAESPFIVTTSYKNSTGRCQFINSPAEPLRTVTAGNDKAVCVPIVSKYHGERPGDRDGRAARPDEPLKTLDTQNRFALVSAFMTCCNHSGGFRGQEVEDPMCTLTAARDSHGVVAATITEYYGQSTGRNPDEPLSAIAGMNKHGVVTANVVSLKHGESPSDARRPLRTICAGGTHHAVMETHLAAPFSASDHTEEVRAFLVKYYSSGGRDSAVDRPAPTITTKDRLGLVTVSGVLHQIVDIGLRMLEPAELLRCQFGKYAEKYVLWGSKAVQVRAIGNSVPPQVVEAIVAANYPPPVARATERSSPCPPT